MTFKIKGRVLALALSLVAFGTGGLSAEALPMAQNQQILTANVVDAQFFPSGPFGNQYGSYRGGVRMWQPQRDGYRCRTQYGNCRHYYQGYYYQNPWWTLPLIVGGAIAGQNGGSHVARCLARYRSYNSRTDTWVGNNGVRYRCRIGY